MVVTPCGLVICVTTILEEPAACIFRVEGEGSRFLQNDGNHLTNYQSTEDHKLKEDESFYFWL